jgi:cation diffusion facilitator family transporter
MASKQQTAFLSILAAGFLVALKLITGIITGSLGLISAAVESSGDIFAAGLTFLALRLSDRPADSEHHFGHARVENLSALMEAIILMGGGLFIVFEAIQRLLGKGSHLHPTWPVFLVLVVVLIVDLSRTIISFRSAKEYSSAALRSNAFHFGIDFIGSLTVLIGLLFAAAGYAKADAISALMVSFLIFAAALRLIAENVGSLMDKAPAGAEAAARGEIDLITPSVEVRRIRVREAAGKHFTDVIVGVSATAALAESHLIADQVEDAVLRALPGSDVVVHVEPTEEGSLPVERVLAAALSIPGVREAHNVTLFELDGHREVSIHIKVPGDMSLKEGHEVGESVEEAIIERVPGVKAVQTHLEPLEGHTHGRVPNNEETDSLEEVIREVSEMHGARVDSVRFLQGEKGIIGFVDLGFSEKDISVSAAHERASEIERRIHQKERLIRELVIHTEP